MDKEEPAFKMAHNNPEEAAKFVANITTLVRDLMIELMDVIDTNKRTLIQNL